MFCRSCIYLYEAMMYLNSVIPVKGQNQLEWHKTLISSAGPIITIIQGIVIFLLLKKHWNKLLYPLLFVAFFMRFLAGAVSLNNPNDEARISMFFEMGLLTLPILVSAVLFYMLYVISKQYKLGWKFQTLTTIIIIVFISLLIFADQYWKIQLL